MQTKTHQLRASIRQFLRCQRGATAIEYAIIASGVAVAIITVVWNVGSALNDLFVNVQSAVSS